MNLKDKLPTDRLESRIPDFKPALDDHEAHLEASRCINCFDAPCIHACPTHIDIPKFIRRIGAGQPVAAARTILDSNILGHSCAVSCPTEVLCEGACVYNSLDKKPILIGKLQRFAVEKAYAADARFYEPGKPTGKRVALVGAGPASLACAHELRRQGHETVIFEKADLPGGLNTYGIAPYKMRAETSANEIARVLEMGIEVRFGQELGRDVTLGQLTREYDAVFLGLGLGPDSRIEAEGADLPAIRGAVELISHLKTAPAAEMAWVRGLKAALVVGGGNTALDACRELKKLGVPRVFVSYRRGEEDMSGYSHEFKHARQEGVEFLFHTLPVRFEALPRSGPAGGPAPVLARVKGTRVAAEGRVELTDQTQEIEVGLVLMATGQAKLDGLLKETPGLVFERGKLKVDADGRTGNPRIFAGGDLANGGKEVVNAVAEGKQAALAIHVALTGAGKGGR